MEPGFILRGFKFRSFATHSGEIQKGDLFIPLRGRRDGHDFIKEAFQRGAQASLIEREFFESSGYTRLLRNLHQSGQSLIVVEESLPALWDISRWYRQQFKIPAIAVTGSVGKTTLKEMLKTILQKRFRVLATPGNYNNEIGIPKTLACLADGYDVILTEMGTRNIGDIDLLASIVRPKYAVITNVFHSHIGRFGSRQAIANAKYEITKYFDDDSILFLNRDDNYFDYLSEIPHSFRIVSFGRSRDADIRVSGIRNLGIDGTRFTVTADGERAVFAIPIPGEGMVLNFAACVAVLREFGFNLDELREHTKHLRPFASRLHIERLPENRVIIDDTYNSSPESVIDAVKVLFESPAEGKRIAVLGDILELGEFSKELHRRIGRGLRKFPFDLLVLVGKEVTHLYEGFTGEEYKPSSSSRVSPSKGLKKERIILYVSEEHLQAPDAAGFASEIVKVISRNLTPGSVILLKASRALKFEGIRDRLLERFSQ